MQEHAPARIAFRKRANVKTVGKVKSPRRFLEEEESQKTFQNKCTGRQELLDTLHSLAGCRHCYCPWQTLVINGNDNTMPATLNTIDATFIFGHPDAAAFPFHPRQNSIHVLRFLSIAIQSSVNRASEKSRSRI